MGNIETSTDIIINWRQHNSRSGDDDDDDYGWTLTHQPLGRGAIAKLQPPSGALPDETERPDCRAKDDRRQSAAEHTPESDECNCPKASDLKQRQIIKTNLDVFSAGPQRQTLTSSDTFEN